MFGSRAVQYQIQSLPDAASTGTSQQLSIRSSDNPVQVFFWTLVFPNGPGSAAGDPPVPREADF